MKYPKILIRAFLLLAIFAGLGCQDEDSDLKSLKSAINEFESAWASGDFAKVESFYTADAKRLHTEPEVWDRAEIKRYFEEKAAEFKNNPSPDPPADWKAGREYIEIRVEGDIAYDIFTTNTFKAMHIWERQDDTWKIKYDMGILDQASEN